MSTGSPSKELNESEFTSICIRRRTKQRLESLRPYESLSWTEFIDELADNYEARQIE